MLSTHEMFLRLKAHPEIAKLIEGGKVVEYGAKTLPEGGWHALPKFSVDGAVMLGDSAGLLNCMRLKGIHLAMKSGMLAGDRLSHALAKDDFSATALDYRADLNASWAGRELRRSRNFRQWFHGGMLPGIFATGLRMFTGGALPWGRKTMPPDYASLEKLDKKTAREAKPVKTDTDLYLDIETDVFKSGTVHREEQAPHCRILDPEACARCKEEYDAPCTRFCPAKVYEEQLDAEGNFEGIHVSFSNCVHCKTCEIKDPLRNLKWHPPEGGDGPKYKAM
jgi:electron-transferring-flavoprotein dehydrogenase